MRSFIAIFALVALASGVPLDRHPHISIDGRIVGGEDAAIEEAPYQVSIQVYGSHYCGGSILNEHYVLTAGHCAGMAAYNYQVRAGSNYTYTDGTYHEVTEVVAHEQYGSRQGIPFNDIAVMRVTPPFKFGSAVQKVSLFENQEQSVRGADAFITGFGRVDGGFLPTVLQKVHVPIISKEECDQAYSYVGGLPTGQICAALPEGGKDACQGDSGGPLTINGRQAGVVSWGIGCGVAGNPGAYTEVAYYRDWIRDQTDV